MKRDLLTCMKETSQYEKRPLYMTLYMTRGLYLYEKRPLYIFLYEKRGLFSYWEVLYI